MSVVILGLFNYSYGNSLGRKQSLPAMADTGILYIIKTQHCNDTRVVANYLIDSDVKLDGH